MAKERKDKHFIKKPIFEGGPKALNAFIQKHKKYPEQALQQKIEGTVHVRYTIDHKGTVIGTKVIAGIGYGCDEEAERVVRLLRFTVPKNRGVRAQFHKDLRIHFKLPKAPKPKAVSMQYAYTSKPEKQIKPEKAKNKPGGGYSYTVEW